MAKKSKGKTLWTLTMLILTLAQVGTLGLGLTFIKRVEEAELMYLKQQARKDVEWEIDQVAFRKNEKEIPKQFLANANRSIYGFYHSDDQDLILTVESPVLKRLFNERYLIVTESQVGDHLFLTIYYNPLHDKKAELKDMTPVYQVVRYQKPELVKLYEKEEKKDETGSTNSDHSSLETATLEAFKTSTLTEAERLQYCLNVPSFEPLYPFESDQIIKETEDFIVYQVTPESFNEDVTNINFYQLYLEENSIQGTYGFNKDLFFPTLTEEQVSDEAE